MKRQPQQTIDEQDIQAVVDALGSPWLTTGPLVARFEDNVAAAFNARRGIAVSSGTSALHAAMDCCQLKPGDEVIVPAISFVATANAVVFAGAKPVFADVNPHTILLDSQDVLRKLSPRTRAIIAVDYAGQTCDYPLLRQICRSNDLLLVADACHSLGARSFGRDVPNWADLACYSFHPVKPITTCEGGMVVTNDDQFAKRIRMFRNHGIDADHHQRADANHWSYDMLQLGFNYRLTDVQAALGISQLKKLKRWTLRREQIADRYRQQLREVSGVTPLLEEAGAGHANHLFVVRWQQTGPGVSRDEALRLLRNHGVAVNVHYRPIYHHSFYKNNFADQCDVCPNAELAYSEIMSLPIFPMMSDADVDDVVRAVKQVRCESVLSNESEPAVVRRAA